MTYYLLYKGILHVKYPEYVRTGDRIYSVSSEVRGKWDHDRSQTAKDAIGHIRYFSAPGYTYKVKCTDGGMWSSWKIAAILSQKSVDDALVGTLRGYRTWRLWEIIGISQKTQQKEIMEFMEEEK